MHREIAQLGRALGLGPRCRRFESCFPDHFICECSSMARTSALQADDVGSTPITRSNKKYSLDFGQGFFVAYSISFSRFSKYSGNSSISLYLDTPNFIIEFFNVVSATNLSASLQRSSPTVGSSLSVFSKASTAFT